MNLTEQPTDYDYPLVTETGVTFVSDADLLRFIAERCGDEVCRFLEKKLRHAEASEKMASHVELAMDYISDITFDEISILRDQAIIELQTAKDACGKKKGRMMNE